MTLLENCISPNQLPVRSEQLSAAAKAKMMPILPIASSSDADGEIKPSSFLNLLVPPKLITSITSIDQKNVRLTVSPSALTDTEKADPAHLLLPTKANASYKDTNQRDAEARARVGISSDDESRDFRQLSIPRGADLNRTIKEQSNVQMEAVVFASEHKGVVGPKQQLLTATTRFSGTIKASINTQLELGIFCSSSENQADCIRNPPPQQIRPSDVGKGQTNTFVDFRVHVPTKEEIASVVTRSLLCWPAFPKREAYSPATSAGVALSEQGFSRVRDTVHLSGSLSGQALPDLEPKKPFESADWNNEISGGKRNTLSAFEQVCAIRFDCGPLFGHAADLHGEIAATNIEIAYHSVQEMTRHMVPYRSQNLNHFACLSVLQLARSDGNNLGLISDASALSQVFEPNAQIGLGAEDSYPELSKMISSGGESQTISKTRDVGALKSKTLGNLISSVELMIADGAPSSLALDAEPQASQSPALSPKSDAIIAALRAQMSPVMVAIYTFEQGLRVFARTGLLSLAGRQKLREDIVTMMAQHGRPISQANLQIDEAGLGQNLRRSAQ